MIDVVTITLGGMPLSLRPDRTAHAPDTGVLFAADLHWGKAAAFRALGVPVPRGSTDDTLSRLSHALTETGARHLVILGDLWHDRSSRSAAFDAALATWRERHAGVAMTLVRGNHDRRAGDPAESLAIACVDEPWSLEGVALHHHPPANDGPWLAGHVHPAARLTGLGRQALVVPCFHQRGAGMVLPAFGAFTGRGVIEPRRGDLLHCIAGDAVITRAVGR
ncbi:MAG TPA: ligase-associated DNA damage response endonuclease PdeM [Gemmatimonadales bacterium]|nr:ligase-associated DNA damage response endonuclease PdeM [Gemmatimonadales bacterium]